MTRLLLCLPILLLASPSAADEVVGPQVCRACHAQAFATWKTGPHARASADLAEHAKDPQCTTCHAPQVASGVSGVSCEACHGAGEHYSAPYVMRDAELARLIGLKNPGDKECKACHDDASPSLRKWDHASMFGRIDHWTADRAARKTKAADATPSR